VAQPLPPLSAIIPAEAQTPALDVAFAAGNVSLGRLIREDGERVDEAITTSTELLQAARLGIEALFNTGRQVTVDHMAGLWWGLRLFARLLQTDRKVPASVLETANSEGAAGGLFLRRLTAGPAEFAGAPVRLFERVAAADQAGALAFVDHLGTVLAGEPTVSDGAVEIAALPPQDPDALAQLIKSDERFNYFQIRDGVGRAADTRDITVELVRNLDGTFAPSSSVPQFIFVRLGFARNPDSLEVMRDLLFASLDSKAREVTGKLKEVVDRIRAAKDTREDAALTNLKRDPKARQRLIIAIRRARDAQAIPALTAALEDKDPQVRAAAADALKRLDAKEAIPALEKSLTDKDMAVREQAALALAFLGAGAAALIKAFKGSKGRGKAAIIEAQGVLFFQATDDEKKSILANIESATKDKEPEVRIGALLAARATEDPTLTIDLARRALADKDEAVQAAAIDVLRDLAVRLPENTKEVSSILKGAISDLAKNPVLQERAQDAVEGFNDDPGERVGTSVNGVRNVGAFVLAFDVSGSTLSDPDDVERGKTKAEAGFKQMKDLINSLKPNQRFNIILASTVAFDEGIAIFKSRRLSARDIALLEAEGRLVPGTLVAGDLVPESVLATDQNKAAAIAFLDRSLAFLTSDANRSSRGFFKGRYNLFDSIIRAFADRTINKLWLGGDFRPTAGSLTDSNTILDAIEGFVKYTRVRIDTVVFGSSGVDRNLATDLATSSRGRVVERSAQKMFPDVLPGPVFFADPVDMEQDILQQGFRVYEDTGRLRASSAMAERMERSADSIAATASVTEGVRFKSNLQLQAAQLRATAAELRVVADRELVRASDSSVRLSDIGEDVLRRLRDRGASEEAVKSVEEALTSYRLILRREGELVGNARQIEAFSFARFDFTLFPQMSGRIEGSRRRVEESSSRIALIITAAEQSIQTENSGLLQSQLAAIRMASSESSQRAMVMSQDEGTAFARFAVRLDEKIASTRSLWDILARPARPGIEEVTEQVGRALRQVRPRDGFPLRRAAPRAP